MLSEQNSLALRFRVDIDSDEGYPCSSRGWYNSFSGKLSYTIVYRGVGRIYGAGLGRGAHQTRTAPP